MKKILLIAIVAMMSGCIPTNLTPINTPNVTLDLNRYLGKWYQIAALPQVFSFNAKCVTAEYSLNTDGSIKVLNKQIKEDGTPSEITGKATVEPNSGNTKLRVGFFGIQPAASNSEQCFLRCSSPAKFFQRLEKQPTRSFLRGAFHP